MTNFETMMVEKQHFPWFIERKKLFEEVGISSEEDNTDREEKHLDTDPGSPDSSKKLFPTFRTFQGRDQSYLRRNIREGDPEIEQCERDLFLLRNRKRSFECDGDAEVPSKCMRTSPLDNKEYDDVNSREDLSQFAASASCVQPLDPTDPEEEDYRIGEILASLRTCTDGYWSKQEEPEHLYKHYYIAAPALRPLRSRHDYSSGSSPSPTHTPKYENKDKKSAQGVIYRTSRAGYGKRREEEPMFAREIEDTGPHSLYNTTHKATDRTSPNWNPKSTKGGNNRRILQKEDVSDEICPKANKPKVRREYYYPKNSKTIYRWTCCGSQAKDHPDSDD